MLFIHLGFVAWSIGFLSSYDRSSVSLALAFLRKRPGRALFEDLALGCNARRAHRLPVGAHAAALIVFRLDPLKYLLTIRKRYLVIFGKQ